MRLTYKIIAPIQLLTFEEEVSIGVTNGFSIINGLDIYQNLSIHFQCYLGHRNIDIIKNSYCFYQILTIDEVPIDAKGMKAIDFAKSYSPYSTRTDFSV